MADPNERTITLGKKSYPVKLTLGVLAAAEGKSGRNYMDPAVWDGGLKAGDIVALVWAIVADAGPEIVYEVIGDKLKFGSAAFDIRSTLYRAATDAVTPVDEDPKAPFASASSDSEPEPASSLGSRTSSTAASPQRSSQRTRGSRTTGSGGA